MKKQRILNWLITLLVFFLVAAAVFSGVVMLTATVFQRIGWHPTALVVQLINFLLGLALMFVVSAAFGLFFRSRRGSFLSRAIGPIIDALERIAEGDYEVRVDPRIDRHSPAAEPVTRLARTVNVMAEELSEMERMRQEFVANVSHEIQSPLTSIRGFARVLQSDGLSPEERKHYLAIIETESMRLSRLTENLLELASLDAESVAFEPEPYRLDDQIRELILACEPQWMEKNIEMDVALDEVTIRADADLLGQVWMNLIHNGIKFTGEKGTVHVALIRRGDEVQFTITDTGIGISASDREHVFERFFKADKSHTRSNGGSGLGLAIAKKIVDLHGGTITLDSQPGKGTTFTVALPSGL
jgi:signal transduction histidine kinase